VGDDGRRERVAGVDEGLAQARQPLRQRRLEERSGDERPPAPGLDEEPVRHEGLDRAAKCPAAHPELAGEVRLGRQPVVLGPLT
jgi:hypothetical protein